MTNSDLIILAAVVGGIVAILAVAVVIDAIMNKYDK
tara:strand:+ start:1894 stop:2001 length:108 start_codon:yes stop_codon:yes gene_type:complete